MESSRSNGITRGIVMRQSTLIDSQSSVEGLSRRQFLVEFIVAWTASMLPLSVQDASAATSTLNDPLPNTQEWRSILHTIFPHEKIPAEWLDSSAEALNQAAAHDPAVHRLLAAGWAALRQATDGDWLQSEPSHRLASIQAISGGPFFLLLRRTTAFTFYGNPLVWRQVGYDGDAWEFGGWAGRPEFGVLDWLPAPPIQDPGE
jgi:hypothetical protein